MNHRWRTRASQGASRSSTDRPVSRDVVSTARVLVGAGKTRSSVQGAQCKQLSASSSVPGAQMLADRFGAVAGLLHGLLQFFLAHAERLGPVLDFMLFVQVDAGAVLLAAVLQVVGHTW